MKEVLRAILLPPPNSTAPRNGAALDRDSPIDVERGVRRVGGAPAGAFLTLIESPREDVIEFRGKQFRFRSYTNRGTAESARDEAAIDRASSENLVEAPQDGEARGIAADVLDGFGAGARQRNSTAFLASFIAQERLGEGLHNPAHRAASDAYRRAGGSPATGEAQPRLVSFAA